MAPMSDIWPVVHAERRALADDLTDLTPEQWRTPSLCAGWSVHDVLAHMVATAKETPPAFFAGMLRSGFRISRMTEKRIAEERAGGPAATLAAFRAVETATSAPPGPKLSWLGEALVHAEDIRRPAGHRPRVPRGVGDGGDRVLRRAPTSSSAGSGEWRG